MTATLMLDAAKDDPKLAEATAHALINALLMQLEALKKLDKLMYPRDPDDAAHRRSDQMFNAWHAWIAEAGALLGQLRVMPRTDGLTRQAERLHNRWGFARCHVKADLLSLEKARAQVARGETISGKELRRELQLQLHAGAGHAPELAEVGGLATGGGA